MNFSPQSVLVSMPHPRYEGVGGVTLESLPASNLSLR